MSHISKKMMKKLMITYCFTDSFKLFYRKKIKHTQHMVLFLLNIQILTLGNLFFYIYKLSSIS